MNRDGYVRQCEAEHGVRIQSLVNVSHGKALDNDALSEDQRCLDVHLK